MKNTAKLLLIPALLACAAAAQAQSAGTWMLRAGGTTITPLSLIHISEPTRPY